MEIFIVRHTKVAVEHGVCYGQLDVALADSFLEEVAQIKAKLPTQFDATFCSTLVRCKAMAQVLQLDNVQFENDLKEMSFGEWEGQSWHSIDKLQLDTWMADFVNIKTPKGENLQELYNRVANFLDNLRTKNYDKVLIITHSGVIRCVWSYLLSIPLKNVFKLTVGYGEVLTIKMNENPVFDLIKNKGF
jgi:alpha-ribazole phosphatase